MRYLNFFTAFAVVILFFFYVRDDQSVLLDQRITKLEQASEKQAAELLAAKAELAFLRQKVKELEQSSLQGIAEKTSKKILRGLGGALETINQELKAFEKDIEQNFGEDEANKD